MIGTQELILIFVFIILPLALIVKYPSLRKAIGFILIVIGILISLTGLLAIIGIPMIIIGAIFYFVGQNIELPQQKMDDRRIKRKVVIKIGSKTAKCPVCGGVLEVFDKSEGICPQCKNPLEIFYEG